MAFTRDHALAYASGEYASLLAEAGLTASDSQAGLKSVLDLTFRQLDVAQADLVTASVDDSLAADAEALLDYYTLTRIARLTAAFVNIAKGTAGTQVSKHREQFHTQVKAMAADAKKAAGNLGYDLDGSAALFTFNLDYLEPQEAGVD